MYRPYQRTKLVRWYTWYTFFQSRLHSYVNRKKPGESIDRVANAAGIVQALDIDTALLLGSFHVQVYQGAFGGQRKSKLTVQVDNALAVSPAAAFSGPSPSASSFPRRFN